jgi:hypothetical protein
MSHKQVMRSKQYVPVPIPNPPRMPEFDAPPPFVRGAKKTASKRAASYFVTLFRPWSYTALPNLSYSAWATFVQDLQTSGTVLSLFRLAVMTRMSQGFAEAAHVAKLSSDYRHRNVRFWNSKVPDGTARPPGPHVSGTGDDADDAMDSEAAAVLADLARQATRFDETAKDAAKIAGAEKSRQTVDSVLEKYDAAVAVPVNVAPPAAGVAPVFVATSARNDWLVQLEDEPDEPRHPRSPRAAHAAGIDAEHQSQQPLDMWPDASHLSPSQRVAAEAIRQYLPGTNAPPTPFIVCGGPGAGKTFVARYLATCCDEMGYKARSAALAATAAGLLPGGCTLHTLIGLGGREKAGSGGGGSIPVDFSKPIPDDRLRRLRKKFRNVRLLLIDEISMVPVDLLGHVNHRLQIIMENDSLFGGLVVVMFGDFDQLPPVTGQSLAAQQVHICCAGDTLNPLSAAASSLTAFKAARAFFLTQQMRCSDAAWQEVLDCCRTTGTLAPIAGAIKQLSLADCTGDVRWRSATVATFGNRVRQCINSRRAVVFARETGRPVVRWRHLLKKGSAAGCDDERLFGTFVAGAPAYLTKNISAEATENGIHNGTRCKLHSIGYKSSARQQAANDAITAGGVGEVVWVETPDFIVVDIGPRPGLESAPRTAEGNILLTLAPGETDTFNVIAPSVGAVAADAHGAALEPRTYLSNVTVQTFDVDLPWSLTYAKLQGATLEYLVVDLTHYDVPPYATFEMILVALSRVRTGDGMRYIGDAADVARLLALKVNPMTRAWRAGYAENGSLWSKELAVAAYDANGGGGSGGRSNKRQRGRGGASASSDARGDAASAAGRSRGGGVRGGRGRGSGDAAVSRPVLPVLPVLPAPPMHPSALRVLQNAQPATPPRGSAQ